MIFLVAFLILLLVTVLTYIRGKQSKRIIASMTTSPSRITNQEFRDVIDVILEKQTVPVDFLVLNLPKVFKRTGESVIVPDWVKNHPRIKVNIVPEDLGPITKILPTLEFATDSDVIISFDDDIIYPLDVVEVYTKTSDAFPEHVITHNILEDGKRPTYIEGFMGVLYKKRFFKDFDTSLINIDESCFKQDDLLISNHLEKYGVPVKSFLYKGQVQPIKNDSWVFNGVHILNMGTQGDALHKTGAGTLDTAKECSIKLESVGKLYRRHADGTFSYNQHD